MQQCAAPWPRCSGNRLSCTGQSRGTGLRITQVKFRPLTCSPLPPLLQSCNRWHFREEFLLKFQSKKLFSIPPPCLSFKLTLTFFARSFRIQNVPKEMNKECLTCKLHNPLQPPPCLFLFHPPDVNWEQSKEISDITLW